MCSRVLAQRCPTVCIGVALLALGCSVKQPLFTQPQRFDLGVAEGDWQGVQFFTCRQVTLRRSEVLVNEAKAGTRQRAVAIHDIEIRSLTPAVLVDAPSDNEIIIDVGSDLFLTFTVYDNLAWMYCGSFRHRGKELKVSADGPVYVLSRVNGQPIDQPIEIEGVTYRFLEDGPVGLTFVDMRAEVKTKQTVEGRVVTPKNK